MAKKEFPVCYVLFALCFLFVASFAQSPGKLSRVHGELKGAKNCVKCHTAQKEIAPSKCLGCHKELALRITMEKGYHRDKGGDCFACHQEHQGENARLVQWNPGEFDHGETGYLLTGSHRKLKKCDRCHTPANSPPREKSKTYFLKDNRCSACHKSVHNWYQPNCTACHSTTGWSVDIW